MTLPGAEGPPNGFAPVKPLPQPASRSAPATPRTRPWLGLAAGLATAAVVVALDVTAGPDTPITTALILAPFVTALMGAPRATIVVACVVTGLAALSGIWNDNFEEGANYLLRLALVAAGGAVGIAAALGRARAAVTRERFAVLMEVARVVDDTLSLEETVGRLSALIVPAVADLCIFDVNRGGALERLSVRASGGRSAEIEALLHERGASTSASGLGAVLKTCLLYTSPSPRD